MRIGFSKDIHNLKEKKDLIIGNVVISSSMGVDAYSDGDVLLHAICESLLGAMGMNDLGHYFNEENQKENFSSLKIVDFVIKNLQEKKYKIENIDTIILLDKIKLLNFIDKIKKNVAGIFNIKETQVSIKATTSENNFVNFIECNSVVLIEKVK